MKPISPDHDEEIPAVRIRPTGHRSWSEFRELWAYRELLGILMTRDVRVRYKQTVIGAGWVVLQPLLTVIAFTWIFGRIARIPSGGIPYPVFAFAALLPWMYFAQAIARCASCLVSDGSLIGKVYFPRLILPVSATLSPVIDLAATSAMMLLMLISYGIIPGWRILALPFLCVLAIASALAFGLWLAALNVRFRDVGNAVPFLLQIWMYASPVAYPMELVPVRWRSLYSLNPMTTVIEGFRWSLLGRGAVSFHQAATSISVVVVLLIGGVVHFRKAEETIVDLL